MLQHSASTFSSTRSTAPLDPPDTATITIACDRCGHLVQARISCLDRRTPFPCNHCHNLVEFENSRLGAWLRSLWISFAYLLGTTRRIFSR
jgi:hypothetical protein